ncbi:MAG: hypothetical protein M1829_003010 [Trizodia sp. TS-e1964]|nr:MAG: hypothetical protein M1829_003010 [Trizodia sp. TS-e1964]
METRSFVEHDHPHSPSTGSSTSPSESLQDSLTTFDPDPHGVSEAEAQSFYSGLPSKPRLLYRTGKDAWSPAKGPEAYSSKKELCAVFDHPIVNLWNNSLAWEAVNILDNYTVRFSSIDVVRFRDVTVEFGKDPNDAKKKTPLSPITIWIGVIPELTSATAAHDAAEVILALLSKKFHISNIDIHFRNSVYFRAAVPKLRSSVDDLDPIVNVASPLTTSLGLGISTVSMPFAEGTMALYLQEGGRKNRLLGLTCRHVVFGPLDGNTDYTRHPGAPARKVILLGNRAFADLVDATKAEITAYDLEIKRWAKKINSYKGLEDGSNAAAAKAAGANRAKTQRILDEAKIALVALKEFFNSLDSWKKPNNRVLGHVIFSPSVKLGVDEKNYPEKFTEDWALFTIDQAKLSANFQGNNIDLGTKITPAQFAAKCHPLEDTNWDFEYPEDRMLKLCGIIPRDLLTKPNMRDANGDPCLLVVKHGNTSGTTLGRANGVFSITREYSFHDVSHHYTSMEWCILSYDSNSSQFSQPGDSGSAIADINGRVGGILTGGGGKSEFSDTTYATPMWWVLKRIRDKGFPSASLYNPANQSRKV